MRTQSAANTLFDALQVRYSQWLDLSAGVSLCCICVCIVLLVLVTYTEFTMSALCSMQCSLLLAVVYLCWVHSLYLTITDCQESVITNAHTCLCLLCGGLLVHTQGLANGHSAWPSTGGVCGRREAGVCSGNWPSAPAAGN